MDSPARRVSLARWVITLGGAGFLSGFIGPIVLNPDANQGPLLGLFITGPGGALAGLVLGVLFRSLPISDLRRLQACWFACAAISLTTLYICLPSPALLGYVIDAQVERCAPLRDFENDALAEWDAAVARAPWAKPAPGWRQQAASAVEGDTAVVLTMRVSRRSPIFQLRKPWNFHRKSAGPWVIADSSQRYYARDDGASCATYLARQRTLYWPYSNSMSGPGDPPREWPPTDPPDFLSLQILGSVPEEFRPLLR